MQKSFKFGVIVLIICNFVLTTKQTFPVENTTEIITEPKTDYLIIAQHSQVYQIDLQNEKSIKITPTNNETYVTAVEFDSKNNCIFWVHRLQGEIYRSCKLNQSAERLVQVNIGFIEGLSYDWMSELLYFVDAGRSKIEVIKPSDTIGTNRLRRTIISVGTKQGPSKLRGIVVHPQQGYIYWTDWAEFNPSISRANLDGSDSKKIVQHPHVMWPNGVTIDYKNDQIYWTDGRLRYIGRCDLDGGKLTVITRMRKSKSHPYAIAVHNSTIFWNDFKSHEIHMVNKETGMELRTINVFKESLDIKVSGQFSQSGTNACNGNHNCTHICTGAPSGGFSCLCPEGFRSAQINGSETCWCPGFRQPNLNGTCPQINGRCPKDFFECTDKMCIPNILVCDGFRNCFDGSDELKCHNCDKDAFKCKFDAKCIPIADKCDGITDCLDGSDEESCPSINCKENQFRCNDHKCILKSWVCDGDNDCLDGSDEVNCPSSVSAAITCDAHSLSCGDGTCIHLSWKCDGEKDCANGLDELGCISTSTLPPITSRPVITADVQLSNSMIRNVTFNATTHILKWSIADLTSREGLNFSIDYGTELKLDDSPKIVTQDLEVELKDLESCEKYTASVSFSKLRLSDIFSRHPKLLHFHTSYNEELKATLNGIHVDSDTKTMVVSWSHSCHIEGEHPPFYTLSINDVYMNRTSNYKIMQDRNVSNNYTTTVQWGALYEIKLDFPEIKSNATFLKIVPLKLPTPSRLFIYEAKNYSYHVIWNEIELKNASFQYEVLVVKGLVLNATTPTELLISTTESTVIIDSQVFAQFLTIATNFTVGVRIRTSLGYPSIINCFEHIEVQPMLSKTDESGTTIGISNWIIVVAVLVIFAQIALITHFVMVYRPIIRGSAEDTAMTTWRIRDRLYDRHSANHNSLPIIEEHSDSLNEDDEMEHLVNN